MKLTFRVDIEPEAGEFGRLEVIRLQRTTDKITDDFYFKVNEVIAADVAARLEHTRQQEWVVEKERKRREAQDRWNIEMLAKAKAERERRASLPWWKRAFS